MAKVKAYNKLSDLYEHETVGNRIEQDADFTVHRMEVVHDKPVQSPVFRANYFSFVLVTTGKGYYTIDDHKFETRPHTVYFTNPGHLKSFGIEEVVHGFIITTSADYLKVNIHAEVFAEFGFLLTELVPPCYLDEARYLELHELATQIMAEQAKPSPLRHKIVSSLFMVFLLKVKAFLLEDRSFKVALDRDSEIVHTFKVALEAAVRRGDLQQGRLQVATFAETQSLHPAYFSTVITSKTGRSPNQWIQQKMIAEAKALLSKSTDSIKLIAYQLGFQAPTHFSKFFKKHTGQTPGKFRKSGNT